MASLASVAYCPDSDMDAVKSWNCGPCNDSNTPMSAVTVVDADTADSMRVIVAKLKEQDGCMLSFRGSENVVNWIRNFEFWSTSVQSEFPGCEGCALHSGFKQVWDSAKDKVIAALGKVGCSPTTNQNILYVTGHSMGGAVTHIAMFD